MNKAKEYLGLVQQTIEALDHSAIEKMANLFLETYHAGGNIYTFGNGGSGASASHAAGDFLKGASYGLEKRFRMICLNDNAAALMAIANDIGYEDIFVEQLKNFIKPIDLVIGISGSGNSENVVRAIEFAKTKNAKTVAMTGFGGGKISQMADVSVNAPVMDMEVTEDIHMMIFNVVKKQMQAELLGDNPSMGKVYDQRTP